MAKRKTIPAISIIIPMYNIEKYIGECLESILAQTFKDYEVIVVDDCSTDNSAAIVESYIPKFRREGVDRLNLLKLKVNSDGAGKPRNMGLSFAVGDYIFFMDGDDAMIKDALEKLHTTAEKFNADVVHCNNYLAAPEETVSTDLSVLKEISRNPEIITTPTFMTDDLTERIKNFLEVKFMWEPWNHLIRRTLLIENELKFSRLTVIDDALFSFFLICLAKKIVCIPSAFYVWRTRQNSNSREPMSVEKIVHRRIGDVFRLIECLDGFSEKFELLRDNMNYRYAVFDFFANTNGMQQILDLYSQVPVSQFDWLIREELKLIEDKTASTSFLFGRMALLNLKLFQQQQTIRQLQAQIQQLQK